MAGLTAAWELSRPGWRDELESITVYQRGWTLGGKGASVRGRHGRIEEHGLHVWLGYYDNAFRLMRQVYEELDRTSTAPTCPVQTFEDAFFPAGEIGVGVEQGDEWRPWTARFPSNDLQPGVAGAPAGPFTGAELVRRATQLLTTAIGSLPPTTRSPQRRGVFLSSSPAPPTAPTNGLAVQADKLRALLRQAELAGLVASLGGLSVLERAAVGTAVASSVVLDQLEAVRRLVEQRLLTTEGGRRAWQLVDLVLGCAQGMIEDGLLTDESLSTIDHLDFRAWLAGRVAPETLDSPLVAGLYDLVFAYEEGDRARPSFSAGLGLFLASRLFFDYRGSIFWKMRAGMGDIVFAPLYEALRARGVRIALFHRLERLELDVAGASVAGVCLEREAGLAEGRRDYEPLVPVRGLPCFPAEPLVDQLGPACAPSRVELRAGRDFDVVILAVSVGALPQVAAELIERSDEWRRLVRNVRTVGTQAFQVWMQPDETALGWEHPGATVSGYGLPFETYASMSHVIAAEGWQDGSDPGSVAYFCSVLPDSVAFELEEASAKVGRDARSFLGEHAGAFWPRATDAGGRFRWELVHRPVPRDGEPAGTLPGLYTRANTDRSDRYVQSLPGSGEHRLRVDRSGFDNLVLAGDWTRCGLDAGCIEAAVMSGIEAANVVQGRSLTDGLLGRWYGLREGSRARTDAPAGREAP